jgi:hypothetical protein
MDQEHPAPEIVDTPPAVETDSEAGAPGCATPPGEAGCAWSRFVEWLFGERAPLLAGVRLLDRFVNWVRGAVPVAWYDQLADLLTKLGHAGLVLAEATCILLGLVAAIRLGNWRLFPAGLGVAILLAICQYTATRFLDAGKTLLKASPSRLGSAAFLDCLALLVGVLGLILFCTHLGSWSALFTGLALWALCDAVAFIALHPDMVNLSVQDRLQAGEEAIGIMSFGVKAVVRLVPIAFGVGAVFGSISLLIATFAMMGKAGPGAPLAALRLIAGCVLLPFLSYVVFAFYHLAIDVLRAVLVLPEKLERRAG